MWRVDPKSAKVRGWKSANVAKLQKNEDEIDTGVCNRDWRGRERDTTRRATHPSSAPRPSIGSRVSRRSRLYARSHPGVRVPCDTPADPRRARISRFRRFARRSRGEPPAPTPTRAMDAVRRSALAVARGGRGEPAERRHSPMDIKVVRDCAFGRLGPRPPCRLTIALFHLTTDAPPRTPAPRGADVRIGRILLRRHRLRRL